MQKIALITGCSSGFGLLTTIDMANAGFFVIATMRDLARRAKFDQAVMEAGVAEHVELRRLDVTEFDALPAAVFFLRRSKPDSRFQPVADSG